MTRTIFTTIFATLSFGLSACQNPESGPVSTPEAPSAQAPVPNVSDIPLTAFERGLKQRITAGFGVGYAMARVNGGDVETAFIGLADKADDVPITENTLFEIGSITKTFTALLLADMVVRGEVALNDPVSDYLPSGVTMQMWKDEPITLRHLATHSSGLPRLPDNLDLETVDMTNPYTGYTQDDLYAFLSSYTLTRPVGGTPDYSNLGMGLLGHALSLKAGQPYEVLLRERILTPLGLADTYIDIPAARQSDFATGYNAVGAPTPGWDLSVFAGAGGLRSTLVDMTTYLQAQLEPDSTPLAEAIKLTQTKQLEIGNNDEFIALGWYGRDAGGRTSFKHTGGTGGFRSFLAYSHGLESGAVVLANSSDPAEKIGQAILRGNVESIVPAQADKNLTFTTEELDAFTGTYVLAPTFAIDITRVDDQLHLQATGQPKFPLFPKSETEFFLKVVDASIVFKTDANGQVTALDLHQGGAIQTAKKKP